MLSLEEAIIHCNEKAEELENEAKDWEYSCLDWKHESEKCKECAAEHRQLAGWLTHYKQIIDSGDCNVCLKRSCEYRPELGQLVRYNCPFCERGIADES